MQKVTINVVAEHAGVSKKTVSRVLNNEPNVRRKTKEKVQKVIKDLSYRPSPQARGLASNQSFLIGLVYDNPNKSYVSDIQTGALEICNKEGYHLLIHPTEHESNDLLNDLNDLIVRSRLDGLVLTPPFTEQYALLKMLDELAIPYARVGATFKKSSSIVVVSNDEQASFEMTQHLISLGHSTIGFITGHPDHEASGLRLSGYRRALESNALQYREKYVEQGLFDFHSGEQCARKLLALDVPPTAIFTSNDYMAAGVMKVANQKGISIPHQLSVTGFDDAPVSRYVWPSLTTVRQPFQEMASGAVNMLINCIRNKPVDLPIQFDSKLVIRESTAPVRVRKD